MAERRELTDGVVSLSLCDAAGGDLPEWTPGSHIDVAVTPNLIRQYSLCGDIADRRHWRIAVLRERYGRGGSAYVHDAVNVDDRLTVRGPRNYFTFEPAPRYRFVAGGIGITPILPMIAAAERSGASWVAHYGGRTLNDMAFLDELAGYGDRVVIRPENLCGLIDLDEAIGTPTSDTLIYCCGPAALIDAVEERSRTWPPATLRVERFTAPDGAPGNETAFVVEIASTGQRLQISVGQSILAALRDAGLQVQTSCEEGVCGTCETGVLEGIVDHRDALLTDDEKASNSTMMVCVSRCHGASLTLDL